jgi:SAM-dependent methyltransferase
MAQGDREKWDARYTAEYTRELSPPDDFVLRILARRGVPENGVALDLACGAGRHALDLARRGWLVEAWDVSPIALEILRQRAARKRLLVATREMDLATGTPLDFRRKPFDLVLVVDFLDRNLLESLQRLVKPGGSAIVSTFTVDRPGEHPSLAYCLERGELARGLPGFATEYQEEQGGRANWIGIRESA